jgi:hypothetical protein
MLGWTRIVGVFTAVLAIVGALQFWAFVQSERASLAITSIAAKNLIQAGSETIPLFFTMKNSGRSLAIIKDSVFDAHFGPLPNIPDYKVGLMISVAPIAPDLTANLHTEIPLPTPMNATDAASIKSGALQVQFYGYITYTDVFGLVGNKVSGFCYYYVANPILPNLPPDAEQFDVCQQPQYMYEK